MTTRKTDDELNAGDKKSISGKAKKEYVAPSFKKFPPIRVSTGLTYYYYYYVSA